MTGKGVGKVECSVDGCSREVTQRSLCARHYNLWRAEMRSRR